MKPILALCALLGCATPPAPTEPQPLPVTQEILADLDHIEAGFWDHRQLLDLVRARSVVGVAPHGKGER